MGNCQFIKDNGIKCGSTNGINYIYYRDAQLMWNGEREICQSDSDMVFGKLLLHSQNLKLRIEKLQALRKKIWNKDKIHDEQIRELEREVTRELSEGNKLVSESSPLERKRQIQSEMQNEVFRRIKRMGEILRDHRNKVCRLCMHDLNCTCKEQCRNDKNPRHWGDKISSVALYSQKGYRRETFNFHTICGRIFIGMFGVDLIPTKKKQLTLVQSMENSK